MAKLKNRLSARAVATLTQPGKRAEPARRTRMMDDPETMQLRVMDGEGEGE